MSVLVCGSGNNHGRTRTVLTIVSVMKYGDALEKNANGLAVVRGHQYSEL